jgi:hypothetical protein
MIESCVWPGPYFQMAFVAGCRFAPLPRALPPNGASLVSARDALRAASRTSPTGCPDMNGVVPPPGRRHPSPERSAGRP